MKVQLAACGAQGAADLGHRLQGSDLVVGQHHGQHRGVWPQAGQHRFHAHPAIGRRCDLAELPTLAHQAFGGAQNCRVLDGADHHVAAPRQGGRAQQTQGVGLSSAAREHDLRRLCPQQRRHLAARLLQRARRRRTQAVRR